MGFVRNTWNNLTGGTAAEAIGQGTGQQLAQINRGIGAINEAYSPYANVGQLGIQGAGFLTDPNAQFSFLQNNPLYQMALENANQQTQQSAAARGRLSAGDTLQQLAKNTILSASPLIQQQKGSILDLLQFGGGMAAQKGSNLADLYGTLGATQAAGTIGAANARQQGTQNLLTTGLTAAALFSDRRLKSNISFIRKLGDFNIYSWTWNSIAKHLFGLTGSGFGVVADEVEKIMPEAVFEDRGYKKVNYELIGLPHAS